jgi:hypothetical protein
MISSLGAFEIPPDGEAAGSGSSKLLLQVPEGELAP